MTVGKYGTEDDNELDEDMATDIVFFMQNLHTFELHKSSECGGVFVTTGFIQTLLDRAPKLKKFVGTCSTDLTSKNKETIRNFFGTVDIREM